MPRALLMTAKAVKRRKQYRVRALRNKYNATCCAKRHIRGKKRRAKRKAKNAGKRARKEARKRRRRERSTSSLY